MIEYIISINVISPIQFLKASVKGTFGQSIKWNFTKFLIDHNGIPVNRYGTPTNPNSIRKDIIALLNAKKEAEE